MPRSPGLPSDMGRGYAMLSLLDKALDRFNFWAKRTLGAHAPTLKAYQVPVGLLVVMPMLLFPLLAVSAGQHWWRGGGQAAAVLLCAMTVTAAVNGLFHGTVALVLYLGLWRGKVSLPERKRTRMRVNYLCCPLLYGLIAAWGITALRGQSSGLLLYLNVAAFLLWWLANLVLTLAERRKALPGAA